MKRVDRLQLAVFAALLGVASFAQASLLRAMSVAELVSHSDTIVVGTVVAVHAAWDAQHRKILSTIEVEVQESWKGPASDSHRVTIVQPGGSVGEIEMTVQGMPSFAVGESSLVFLRGQHRFQVVGMSQGKRSLAWDSVGKRWLVESPDATGVVELGKGSILRQAKRRGTVPLADLRGQVARAMGQAP
jgi:hypothetical protein